LDQPHPAETAIGRTLFNAEDPLVAVLRQVARGMDKAARSAPSTPQSEKNYKAKPTVWYKRDGIVQRQL
jgi:hypothetical protein